MNKEFVPYEQALALKELGFDEPCLAFYYDKTKFLKLGETPEWLINKHKASYIFGSNKHDVTLAPTFSQAFRWFREKHNLCGYTVTAPNYIKGESKYKTRFSYEIYGMNEKSSSTVFIAIRDLINVSTHEEAELECLKKLIEIVKEQK